MSALPDFRSDNLAPALEAVVRAVADDHIAALRTNVFAGSRFLESELDAGLSACFGREVESIPVVTGTAANALALSALVPGDGAIFCHEHAHIRGWEAGAYAFYAPGTRLIALPGAGAKIDPNAAQAAIAAFRAKEPATRAAISLTQSTERGANYTPAEIAALGAIAHDADIGVHMDGARFGHAVAALGVTPAETSWRAGVDVLSFGTSKLGSLNAEAIVIFDRVRRDQFADPVKRAGHKLSKRRDLATQILAMLAGDRWIASAAHANRLARRFADGLAALGLPCAEPVDGNQIFAPLPAERAVKLKQAGLQLLEWTEPGLYRFVFAHHHAESDVDRAIDLVRRCANP
jgi:threonine aldolase